MRDNSYYFTMRTLRINAFALAACLVAAAHPMGNFSVSHYARFDVRPQGIQLTYALDLAEIPTFELLQSWKIDRADTAGIESHAKAEARKWLAALSITAGGRAVQPEFKSATAIVSDGAGGLPVLRITTEAVLRGASGAIEYSDPNYAARSGWKEIVVTPHPGVSVDLPPQNATDRSHALQSYPADATIAPPQDTKIAFNWTGAQLAAARPPAPPVPQAATPAVTPTVAPPASQTPTFAEQQQSQAKGTVIRGDYLSRMLGGREITLWMMLAGVCVAFGLGAIHALSPGHGKTIVAAYLVGSRGTMKHALFLGAMVTFTHTVSVFCLGLGVLFFEQYVVPDKVIPLLGAISGLSIVAVGAFLLYQRTKALATAGAETHHTHAGHTHDHSHAHTHADHTHAGHTHDHPHAVHAHADHNHIHAPHSHDSHDHAHHNHTHDHNALTHTHDGHTHTHLPPEKLSITSLIALGVSGGLVPCPSALVLLLSAIALGRAGLGLILLTGFSLGLALVLMGIGATVLYAKNLVPQRTLRSPAFRYVPVFSAVVVIVLGLVMTGVSIGWIQPGRIIG